MSKLDELEKIVLWAKEARNDIRNYIRRRDEVYVTEAQSRFEEELTYDTVLKLLAVVKAAQEILDKQAVKTDLVSARIYLKPLREAVEALQG